MVVLVAVLVSDNYKSIPISVPSKIVDYIDINHNEDTKIFAGFNAGGYVEYRGYKTYIDARPEVYSTCINKTEDIFAEYMNVEKGNIDYSAWLEKYGFTDLIVSETPLRIYLENCDLYEKIMEDGEYTLFVASGE